MKRIFLFSLLPVLTIGALPSFAATPEAASVSGGKINFSGSVIAAPCAVDNSSDGQNVALGQIATNQLATKGSVGSAVPFTIKLVGCDLSPQAGAAEETTNYTKASITFSGATIDATTLGLTANGAGQQPAKNVGIQIFHANKALNVDGTSSSTAQAIVAGENEIPFTATYVATDNAGATAGSANSSVNFKVNYL